MSIIIMAGDDLYGKAALFSEGRLFFCSIRHRSDTSLLSYSGGFFAAVAKELSAQFSNDGHAMMYKAVHGRVDGRHSEEITELV
jgi:hypothetical protein